MSTLPDHVSNRELLNWVIANPNKPFDTSMVVNARHTTDWQSQAVNSQMEELKRQGYVSKLKQDAGGSTYWTITTKGENYVRALERAEEASGKGTIIENAKIEFAAPSIAKSFGAVKIGIGRATSLTFSIANDNAGQTLTGISFEDRLPDGLEVSSPNGFIGSDGGGAVTAGPGSNLIALTGASLAPNQLLQFTVNVTGTTEGVKTNVTSAVSSTESGMGGSATAAIEVFPEALARLLALKLSAEGPHGHHVSMATLIERSIAIIPTRSLDDIQVTGNLASIEFLGASTPTKTTVSAVHVDIDSDFAVLKLASEAPFDLPSNLLYPSKIAAAGEWGSFLASPDTDEGVSTRGRLGQLTSISGHEYQVLGVPSPIAERKVAVGAPVIWNGQLLGLISSLSQGGSLLGILISQDVVEQPVASLQAQAKERATAKGANRLTEDTISRLSERLRAIIARAEYFRLERHADQIHTTDLVLALTEGPESVLVKLSADTKVDIRSALRTIAELKSQVQTKTPDEEDQAAAENELPAMSRNVRHALALARDKANELRSHNIDEIHLVFGLLCTNSLTVKYLNERGITPEKVKFESRPAAQTTLALAGYKSDDPTGEDLLGITNEVKALASVLAARDVEPPLSLGLFGDWGTGKSFFMRLLQSRIHELTEDAKKAEGQSQYCQDVVQLTFNAWNYIDTDLWASLASEIFEGLAVALAERRGGDSKSARALALAAASSSEAVLAEAEQEKLVAEQELKQIEAGLADLERAQAKIDVELTPSELLKQLSTFALTQDDVRKPLESAAKELHIVEIKTKAGEIESEILELGSMARTVGFILKNRTAWIFVCFLALIAAIGAAWAVRYWQLGGVGRQILAALGTISLGLTPFFRWSKRVLTFIAQARDAQQKIIRDNKQKKTEQLLRRRDAVQKRVDEERERVVKAASAVEDLRKQVENMRADRQIVDYIRQRNQSTDYRKHLGVIATVRADLRHLSTLLRDIHDEAEEDLREIKKRQSEKEKQRSKEAKPPLFPRIDRIILYIDDLDRCPETNVIQVLQAVHLLLAFPLFIVVVGVDPRWLLHSLRQHSGALMSDEVASEELLGQERLWESTPMNYLEKIFQIPFTLRPIDQDGFANLVNTFAAQPVEARTRISAAPHADAKTSNRSVAEVKTPTRLSEPMLAPQAIESTTAATAAAVAPVISSQVIQQETNRVAPEPIERYPDNLRIEEWERTFMKLLHEFIPSPRAGKRFINIYRLLRASVAESDRVEFVGNSARGRYQPALILLAILTGYPAQATELFRSMLNEKHKETWGELIRTLREQVSQELEPADDTKISTEKSADGREPKTNLTAIEGSNAHRWLEMLDKLSRLEPNLSDVPSREFITWIPQVARYSFQSGRILLQRY